jgi:hypothetical protein
MGPWWRFLGAAGCAALFACARGGDPPVVVAGDSGIPDAGPPDAGPPDAGPPDAGPPDAGPTFGGPGPWPATNVSYGDADGVRPGDLDWPGVVGFSTDETQNQWLATHGALYVMRPGDKAFRRYDARDGLHLQSNPVRYCDSSFLGGDKSCPIFGAASDPGISEITGGGPNEVFVGYFSQHNWNDPNDGTWGDPFRHMGKVDRVRLKADGTLEVVRFDMVSGRTPMFWHNRIVYRLLYDHFIHKHELYVGTEHGIDKISPDKWFPPDPHWPYGDYLYWMSDHLHPRVCFHEWCTGDEDKDTQMMGGWSGLAIAPDGDLWAGGKWSAGKIIYTPLAAELKPDGTPNLYGTTGWFQRDGKAYSFNFGEQWCGSSGSVKKWCTEDPAHPHCPGGVSGWVLSPCTPGGEGGPPVFGPPSVGDPVDISAVTVTPDGKSWWSSPTYGIASFDGKSFTYYSVSQTGASGTVTDMLALPDGRLAIGTAGNGLTLWSPGTGAHASIRAGSGLRDNTVNRLELDMMVNPPALHVSTSTGASTIRVFP